MHRLSFLHRAQNRGEHECSRDKRDIHHDDVDILRDLLRLEISRVRFLQKPNPSIRPQAHIDLTVARVDCYHLHGAVLEEAIGEATCRGSNIQAGLAPAFDVPMFKRSLKFQSSATDEWHLLAED